MNSVPSLHPAHVQQVECLLVLADELHFGRTADRLGVSQSRVSQLVRALESGVGVRLVERTSRRVALTPAGRRFVTDVGPAHRALARQLSRARERAACGARTELRVGFTGMVYEEITASFNALHARHGIDVHVDDVPLGTPFVALLAGEVDAAIVELPVHERGLTVDFLFPAQDELVALGVGHPLAARTHLGLEELAGVDLLHRTGQAPAYWTAARTPAATPSGVAIPSAAGASTLAHGLALAASGRYGMLVCRPVAERQTRTDLRFVPVRGREGASRLGLVRRAGPVSPPLAVLVELLRSTWPS
ncbi:MAG: LysR family transcriptional regulator [Cellulomonas iranensis]|uniref:LysR family transcriptional regulator n=1 Tax=Cellulomonas iranensis TaxID=76862 RepID=UPI001B019E7B|nr:LysR family transcriptional regulator [Cellulomonas iranensis]MBO9567442.1 LysR family transcriptional regulator [Cellulomonas iranensis]